MQMKNIRIIKSESLSEYKYRLTKVTFTYEDRLGRKKAQTKEIYDRGDGAVILLYNKEKKSILLTKQFRLATYLNHNKDGIIVEACAGQLDGQHPDKAIVREVSEETGYEVHDIQKVFEAYTSPGSVTEILHFYIAAYTDEMKVNDGGGLEEEGEEIEVVELQFDQAYNMIATGEIRDCKTIMLLQYVKIQNII